MANHNVFKVNGDAPVPPSNRRIKASGAGRVSSTSYKLHIDANSIS
jgi:hypothetical protein